MRNKNVDPVKWWQDAVDELLELDQTAIVQGMLGVIVNGAPEAPRLTNEQAQDIERLLIDGLKKKLAAEAT